MKKPEETLSSQNNMYIFDNQAFFQSAPCKAKLLRRSYEAKSASNPHAVSKNSVKFVNLMNRGSDFHTKL